MTRSTAVLNRLSEDRSSVVGYHRFINNPKITYPLIMEGHYRQLRKRIKGKDLICAQDTTEYNYNHHEHILKEGQLGTISDNHSLGLRVHPMLVMDMEGFPYGISSLQILNRANKKQDKHERKYEQLPIEEKESYRWLKSIEETKSRLSKSKSLTIVADRESDIYQLWSRTLDSKTHLVIRTAFRRKFIDDKGEELQPVSSPALLGRQQLYIPGKLGKADKSRTADLEIYSQKAYTLKPKWANKKKTQDLDKIPLYVVTVREVVPADIVVKEPIEWILLTDIDVPSLEKAAEIIAIYKSRWNIEQVFRLTKQKGFALEESQLETAHALTNMITLVLIAAIRIFQMVKSRADQVRPATDVFDAKEIESLKKINPGLEGKTERSRNRNVANSLAFYVWVIARLGHWKPEDRDPPGPITMKRGWDAFNNFTTVSKMISP
ncbi:MAG TPA: IS4 family transposase [Ferruginibacter sp.]|nr:IS4 family transposase [Ferruginibacter sp.]